MDHVLTTATRDSEPTRVLLVDDHAAQRELVKQFLRGTPFAIVGEARDGREAIAMVDRLRPDIVLLDLNMPIMTGIEALPLIRSTHPPATVIVFSDYERSEMWPVVQNLGAAAYVEKDMTSPILGSHLESLVRTLRADRRRSSRLLLVDDDPEAREAFTSFFGPQLKLDIVAVASGDEALKELRRQSYDLIVSDHNMPGMSGLDFLREAKRLAPGVPRMMISGVADADVQRRAVQEADVRAFLDRGSKLEQLVQTLERVLPTP